MNINDAREARSKARLAAYETRDAELAAASRFLNQQIDAAHELYNARAQNAQERFRRAEAEYDAAYDAAVKEA